MGIKGNHLDLKLQWFEPLVYLARSMYAMDYVMKMALMAINFQYCLDLTGFLTNYLEKQV